MLVLKRRENEEVCIDDKIRVRLIHVGRNRVRLGIQAPKHVRVERKELHDARRERTAALARAEAKSET